MGAVANAVTGVVGGVSNAVGGVLGGVTNGLGLGNASGQVNWGSFAPSASENAYLQRLDQYSQGNAPSAAQIQMQQGINQASQQAQALAASQRGISPALAARMAAQSQAGIAQNAAAQGAALRAQEQQNYMNMLGQEHQSIRTGQIGGAQLQAYNANQSANRTAGILGGIGSGIAMGAMLNKGGEVPHMAMGGPMMMAAPEVGSAVPALGPSMGQYMQAYKMGKSSSMIPDEAMPKSPDIQTMGPAPMSRIGQHLSMARGGQVNMVDGGTVPGEARVRGDNLKNDVVPAMLSPKEIVLPRSVTMHPNAPDKAREFVAAIMARKGQLPQKKAA